MFAEYSARPGGAGRAVPHVVLVSVTAVPPLPRRSGTAPLRLQVSLHEEGTPLTWRRTATVSAVAQQSMVAAAEDLRRYAAGEGLTRKTAVATAARLGRELYRHTLGNPGAQVLEAVGATAVLLQVDERLVNLPWELMGQPDGEPLVLGAPFGRVVTTSTLPRTRRDPVAEDTTLHILAVANPTADLAASEAEVDTVRALQGPTGTVTVQVTVLERQDATIGALTDCLRGQAVDLLHFAGHASYDSGDPEASAVHLADGKLTAQQVLDLPWSDPPYVVINSACESARSGAQRRLVSARGRVNGLAAAFLSAGVEAYLGHYWPVGDGAARRFAEAFYGELFSRRNIGNAVLEARRQAVAGFQEGGDLTAFGAVYFGDPGTDERRDTASMAS